ncbi:MAG TPA: hypothetical protein VGN09_26210, partial [Vicinamibacteria bacterium]
ADLVRELEGRESVAELGRPPEETAVLERFVREELLPTGVFGSGSTPARSLRPPLRYVYAARELIAAAPLARLTTPLAPLFRPQVALALLVPALAAHAAFLWQFRGLRLEQLSTAAYAFGALASLLSLPFHELGHGAACRHFGRRHGSMGFAMYLVFPCLYTDVSDAWSLGRWQRVVVDLGGVYFQALTAGLFAALFMATGAPGWAAAVLMVDVSIVHSLKPYLRGDGYWVLTDVAGLPAPYERVKEYVWYLARRVTGRREDAPILASVPAALRVLALAYVAATSALAFWIVAAVLYKTATVVLPSYPHALAALAASPLPSLAFLRDLIRAGAQTVLIASTGLFLWTWATRLLRLLRNAGAGPRVAASRA